MSSSDEDRHPLPPAKRRRIVRPAASDDEAGTPLPAKTRRKSSGSKHAAAGTPGSASAKSARATKPKVREEKEKKPKDPAVKKPKHRIITYTRLLEDDEDVVATQFDNQIPSSPSRVRGARYIKDVSTPPPPRPAEHAVQVEHPAPEDYTSTPMPLSTQVADHTGVGIRPDRGASTAFEDSDSDDDAFVTLSAVQAMARQRRPLEPSTSALNVEPKLSQQMRALKPPPHVQTKDFDDIVSESDDIRPDPKPRVGTGTIMLDLDDDLLDDWDDEIDDEILNANPAPSKAIPSAAALMVAAPIAAAPMVTAPMAPASEVPKPGKPEAETADSVLNKELAAAKPAVEIDEFGDFDLEKELADLPSDAFDSSFVPAAKRVQATTFVEISSSPAPQPAQALAAPTKTLQQRTLFGQVAAVDDQPKSTATQGRQRNFIRDLPPEPPTHHVLNPDTLDTFVYPTNLGRPRSYQLDIVTASLYTNTLVALPTGLGKTFIAATVMLNWLRWTKDAQIVFVAPTRPLVSQQVEACIGIAGIPYSQTSFMTGSQRGPAARKEEWRTKRVFFCTPQIYQNDLKQGLADPKRLVLLVVDEAHRASGKYSYTQIVKHVRRYNESYRILALTATPGGTVEAVQNVIDQLDIARIEIRTEDSIDIKEHTFRKEMRIETFRHSEEMIHIEELLKTAVGPVMEKLSSQNAYWSSDPMTLTNYGLLQARRNWKDSSAGKAANGAVQGMLNAVFDVLGRIAQAIELFKFHGLAPFYHALVAFREGVRTGKTAQQIVSSSAFKSMMSKLQLWTSNPHFVGHPKLERLQDIVQNHFLDAGQGLGAHIASSATRVMIFTKYRPSAEEICRTLKHTGDMIKPHVFVGQADSKDSKGMDQKTQLAVIEKFKAGTYNVLVATSIGEEGLDIGEIDLIICYDASASPVRMLQRMGRTGRKRSGRVYLLMMQGKEEKDYHKSVDSYQRMQKEIANGSNFAYHLDRSRRIMPREIKQRPDYREVQIPEENKGVDFLAVKKPKRLPKLPPKEFKMPEGVATGFLQASRIGGAPPSVPAAAERNKVTAHLVRAPQPVVTERKRATVNLVGVPTTDEVLLSAADQTRLQEQYQSVCDSALENAEIGLPDAGTFWRDQSRLRPAARVPHGPASRLFASTMSKMHACRHVYDRPDSPNRALTEDMSIGLLSQSALPKRKAATKPRKPRAPGVATAPKAKPPANPKPAAAIKAPKAPAPPKPKPVSKPRPKQPAKSHHLDDDSMADDDDGAAEGASSSPPCTDPHLALPTQGEWLGSDTSGDEAEDEEPDSELRDFIVEAGDEEEEELPSSIPLSSQRVRDLQREAPGRRLVRGGPVDLFSSEAEDEDFANAGVAEVSRRRIAVVDTSSPS